MNRQKTTGALLLVLVAGLIGFYMDQYDQGTLTSNENIPPHPASKNDSAEDVTTTITNSVAPTSQPIDHQTTVDSHAQEKLAWNSPAGLEQVNKWMESRGHYSLDELQTYRDYDSDALKQLAIGGDIKAIYAYAREAALAGIGKYEIIGVYMGAAILGSSDALISAAGMAFPHRDNSTFNDPEEEKQFKEDMLLTLSLYQIAILRGDKSTLGEIAKARKQLTLTQADDQYIETFAKELYTTLENKRISQGLGPFDNSVPSIVNDYFEAEQNGWYLTRD